MAPLTEEWQPFFLYSGLKWNVKMHLKPAVCLFVLSFSPCVVTPHSLPISFLHRKTVCPVMRGCVRVYLCVSQWSRPAETKERPLGMATEVSADAYFSCWERRGVIRWRQVKGLKGRGQKHRGTKEIVYPSASGRQPSAQISPLGKHSLYACLYQLLFATWQTHLFSQVVRIMYQCFS